jgi:undecaprenyl-phosphate 4-deoxy-4-formamido-L-arabinose transferase
MPDTPAFTAQPGTPITPPCDAQNSPALSIVIPVYNGAGSIGELVAALEALDIEGGLEIVLVNDGSPDNSRDVCRGLVKRARVPITLVDLSRNYGEHNAVMAGLRHARGAHVITMDDDLQNPPEEVSRLLAFAQQSGREVVYTCYDEKHHSSLRNLGSRFTNWVAGFVLDKPKGFYLSSFRCMSAFVVREVTRYQGPFPYVDGLILQVTQDIDRLLVRHLPRAVGRSNYTLRRLLRLWLSMFVNFSVMPLRVSTLAGLALSVVGAIGGVMAIIEALFSDPPAGWASLISAVLLLSGVQLLILGIVGEYLGRLYLTANGKPQSVIKSVLRSVPDEPAAAVTSTKIRSVSVPAALSPDDLQGALARESA